VKQNLFSYTLIVLVMMLMACAPETVETTVVEVNANLSEEAAQNTSQMRQNEDNNASIELENEDSCQNPSPENAPICAAIEEQILATTVRIELHRWQEVDGKRGEYIDGGTAHATVIDGRLPQHIATPPNQFYAESEFVLGKEAVERLNLSGIQLQIGDEIRTDDNDLRLFLVGIVEPVDPTDERWWGDLIPFSNRSSAEVEEVLVLTNKEVLIFSMKLQ